MGYRFAASAMRPMSKIINQTIVRLVFTMMISMDQAEMFASAWRG